MDEYYFFGYIEAEAGIKEGSYVIPDYASGPATLDIVST
jgi:hypothetical protein